jgi:hypothetical protein
VQVLKAVFEKGKHLFSNNIVNGLLSKLNVGLPFFNESFTVYTNSYNNSTIALEITSIDFPISLLEVKLIEIPQKKN